MRAFIFKKSKVLFTGFQNGCEFQNDWKAGYNLAFSVLRLYQPVISRNPT
jgi:hypothetical protein